MKLAHSDETNFQQTTSTQPHAAKQSVLLSTTYCPSLVLNEHFSEVVNFDPGVPEGEMLTRIHNFNMEVILSPEYFPQVQLRC